MSKFLHDDDIDYAKAIAILRVFSENSRAKMQEYKLSFSEKMQKGGNVARPKFLFL